MKSQIETLLRVSLAQGANYEQKQLLKSDNFGQAIVQVLKARRKKVLLNNFWCYGPALFIIAMQLVSFALSGSPLRRLETFWPIGLIVLMQLPLQIERRAALARIETLVALWFLMEDKEGDASSEPDETLVQLFHTSNF